MLPGRYSPAHLNEVRRYLEVPSARIAASRRSSEDVGRMAEIVAALQDEDDPAQRHKLAACPAHHPRDGPIAEHRAIYDAILRRDSDAAGNAMAAHLNAVDNSFLSL